MARSAILILLILLSGCVFNGPTLDEEVGHETQDMLLARLKAHYDSGEQYYSEGKLELAEKEFQAILQLRPDDENALYRLGNIAFRRGKYDLSVNYFEATVRINPRNSKAHYNLASLRLMQAENHFKYYAAMTGKDTDLSKVTDLLGDIDKFASHEVEQDGARSLDRIAGAIKK